ncbi:Proposed peptidoglycan lipid II flippase MurJ [hydrothermal vent metagenome]|uniref:Proposed peptidoglycan lipid II flippase MurJ n=1 Tax=hydrothermal vent metagenome TaxID=652676 RepID=A0A1W1BF87_9ZZZZ
MSLLKSSFIISLMTFLSRVLGLVRDVVIARLFGTSLVADAFFIAFKIPNFLRRLFAEGAFSQAFVPILSHVKVENEEAEVQKVINVIGSKLLFALIVITLIVVILAPIVVFVFASGFYQTPKFDLTVELLRITFPYLLFISLTAFSGAILNTYNRFAVPAFTPVLLNVSMIICAIYLSPKLTQPIVALAWGVFLGGVAQLLFQIPFLLKIRKLPRLTTKNHSQFAILKKRMLPALFGVGTAQLNLLIDMILASYLVTGSISWLYYANRLFEFPIALLGVALATSSLPYLSKKFIKKDMDSFKKIINHNLKFTFVLGIPAIVGLIVLAQPLLITLFQYENFNAYDVKQASVALIAYSAGLLGFILIKVLANIFFASGDTKTPMKIGVVAITVNIIMNFSLIGYYQHLGLAIATSISAITNTGLLYFYLHKNNIFRVERELFITIFKVIIAVIIMFLVIVFINEPNKYWLSYNVFERVLLLTKIVISAIIVYFSVLFILRVPLR